MEKRGQPFKERLRCAAASQLVGLSCELDQGEERDSFLFFFLLVGASFVQVSQRQEQSGACSVSACYCCLSAGGRILTVGIHTQVHCAAFYCLHSIFKEKAAVLFY